MTQKEIEQHIDPFTPKEILEQMTKDSDPHVRYEALLQLGKVKEAVRELKKAGKEYGKLIEHFKAYSEGWERLLSEGLDADGTLKMHEDLDEYGTNYEKAMLLRYLATDAYTHGLFPFSKKQILLNTLKKEVDKFPNSRYHEWKKANTKRDKEVIMGILSAAILPLMGYAAIGKPGLILTLTGTIIILHTALMKANTLPEGLFLPIKLPEKTEKHYKRKNKVQITAVLLGTLLINMFMTLILFA